MCPKVGQFFCTGSATMKQTKKKYQLFVWWVLLLSTREPTGRRPELRAKPSAAKARAYMSIIQARIWAHVRYLNCRTTSRSYDITVGGRSPTITGRQHRGVMRLHVQATTYIPTESITIVWPTAQVKGLNVPRVLFGISRHGLVEVGKTYGWDRNTRPNYWPGGVAKRF